MMDLVFYGFLGVVVVAVVAIWRGHSVSVNLNTHWTSLKFEAKTPGGESRSVKRQ